MAAAPAPVVLAAPPPVPPTCGYVRGTRQVYGRSISRLPAALPIEARLRIVSIAEATSGPAFRTAGSALPGGGDDLLRIGLDLLGSVFAPCLLGCPGTTRYQRSADGIPPRELRFWQGTGYFHFAALADRHQPVRALDHCSLQTITVWS